MNTSVIYARVSSIGDRQSTERQIEDLTRYAEGKGYEIVKVFQEHISERSPIRRGECSSSAWSSAGQNTPEP